MDNNVMVCASCGLCCSKESLCPACEIATLKANGLSIDLVHEISGLKMRSSSHSNDFGFSELYNKLSELTQSQIEKESYGKV